MSASASSSAPAALRPVPFMGVIHVVAEAAKLGFTNGDPDWCNLGQGQPEVGDLEGAPPRFDRIEIAPADHAYGPVNGIDALRQAVAAHYNRLYRRGKPSQYTARNVSIAAGGRLALSRLFAAIGEINLGYQIPDYTAYEDMLDYHRHRFTPVLLATRETDRFRICPDRLEQTIREQGLGGFLVSNPCNPTGELIRGAELQSYVRVARESRALLILDEFYSHFVYDEDAPGAGPVSAAAHVEDVNADPVLIIDGLTKNFRYPGWRVGWTVGPEDMIDTIGRAASAIDGGPPVPMQRAAVEVLEPVRADQETTALRQAFAAKRALMRRELEALGVRFPGACEGTFYLWGSIAALPAPFNDAEVFFREALKRKVMVVPGRYFDVNPGRRRPSTSPFDPWLRFSFGPPMENVRLGLSRLADMIRSA